MAQLYAIVGGMERARFMLAAGVPVLQLRFKDAPLAPHGSEIARWPREFPGTRLVINDDLEFALSVGAWGAHLGQEDLARYPREALREAPLNLGISSHSDEEMEKALDYSPALLGFGPMFPTATKQTKHAPQGVDRLREVVERVELPLVAIGGINDDNLDAVTATGVAYVAMIAYLDRFTDGQQIAALISRLQG